MQTVVVLTLYILVCLQQSDSTNGLMKCSTEHSHIFKEGRGKPFFPVEVQNLHTVVVDVGLFGSVRCVARGPSKYGPSLIAQSSSNQLALSPSSPT